MASDRERDLARLLAAHLLAFASSLFDRSPDAAERRLRSGTGGIMGTPWLSNLEEETDAEERGSS